MSLAATAPLIRCLRLPAVRILLLILAAALAAFAFVPQAATVVATLSNLLGRKASQRI